MKNRVFEKADNVTLTSAALSGGKSGDPVVVGGISGVLTTDVSSTNEGTIRRRGIFRLTAKAVNDTGNSAIAVGDPIYHVAADEWKLSKKASAGPLYGYAVTGLTAGSTGTIQVCLVGGASSSDDARLDTLETDVAAAKDDILDRLQMFVVRATTAEVNAGTKVIVPGVAGKQFVPVSAKLRANGGNGGGATLVRLVEETSGNVIQSHTIATLTSAAWVNEGTTGAVGTGISVAGTAAKAILIDRTVADLTTATSVDVVVLGYYI